MINTRSTLTFEQIINHCLRLQQQGQCKEALAIINQAKSQLPNNTALVDLATTLHLELGNKPASIESARLRIKLKPDTNAFINLAICYRKFSDFEGGVDALQEELKHHDQLSLELEKLKMEITAGVYNTITEFTKAYDQYKGDLKIEDCIQSYVDAHKVSQYLMAIELAENALVLEPNNLNILIPYSCALLCCDSAKAVEICNHILSISPDLVEAKINLIVAKNQLGELTQSLQLIRELAIEHPDNEEISRLMNSMLLSQAIFKESSEDNSYYMEPQYRITLNGKPTRCPKSFKDLRKYLVYMDQGVGDQIRHSLFLQLLSVKKITISVFTIARLVPLFKSIAPNHHYYTATDSIPWGKFKFACYGGQLAYLFADQLDQNREKLGLMSIGWYNPSKAKNHPSSRKPKIGIAWRSIKPIRDRSAWYPSLGELGSILSNIDADLVVLNGHLNEEENHFLAGLSQECVTVDALGIDAKDDFLSMATLLNELDCALLPPTALVDQAGMVGLKTYLLAAEGGGRWFISEPYLSAFYPNLSYYGKKDTDSWQDQSKVINMSIQKQLSEITKLSHS